MSDLVVATDFGVVVVTEETERAYAATYYRPGAPKKSARIALEKIEKFAAAMMEYRAITGRSVGRVKI